MSRQQKKLFLTASGAALALAAWVVSPAAAATDYFDLSPEQLLSAQVVSVSKTKETVAEAPAAVYVITQEDIARSGMTSIPELLRMVPGVNVAQADANTWAVSIRGFNNTLANKLLVLVDGRTVYNPLFAGTYWEVQDMPLGDVDRIEVIRGPGGTLWGANAVNGVINIITKSARDTLGVRQGIMVGNVEKGTLSARYGASSGDDLFYRTYIKVSSHSAYRGIGGGDANDSWRSYHAGFRADADKDSDNQFTVQSDIYHVDSDQLDQMYSLSAPYSFTRPESVDSSGANILARWKHAYQDDSTFSLQAYLDYTQRNEALIKDSRIIYDLEGQYNLRPMGNHEIIAGANYRLMSDQLTGSSLVSFNPANSTMDLFGMFLQDKITLAPDRLFLTLGSKFEHNDYTGFEYQPNARMEWTPDTRQAVWGAISRAVRTPSRIERDLDITNLIAAPGGIFGADPTELTLTANKSFKSEELTAYELGYRRKLRPNLSMDTTAFVNNYRHLGSLDAGTFVAGINNPPDPIHNLLPLIEVNDMSAEVYGVELASSWEVHEDWKLSATYSFLNMELHAPLVFGTNQETPEHQSPSHQAGLRSYWNVREGWALDTSFYYVSRLSAYKVPAYLRMDAGLGWEINDNLRFRLVGQNLLDNAHREFSSPTAANAAEVPRSVSGRLTWQF